MTPLYYESACTPTYGGSIAQNNKIVELQKVKYWSDIKFLALKKANLLRTF